MEISSRILRRQLLFAVLLLIAPMMLFPELLGTDLTRVSVFNFFVEIIIYAIAVFSLNQSFRFVAVSKAVIVCLLVRLALGVALGLLISVMYALSVSVAITLSISGYLPAIIIHVLVTPLLVQPFIVQFGPQPSFDLQIDSATSSANSSRMGRTTFAVSKSRGLVSETQSAGQFGETVAPSQVRKFESEIRLTAPTVMNGFERAMRYLGEDGSVSFAGIVDGEGLLMANFKRRDAVPEDLAPLSLVLFEANSSVLRRGDIAGLQKVDLSFDDQRVIVAFESGYHLMVVANENSDDVLNVRINQALEMIRKYVEERYPMAPVHNAESEYV